MNLKEHLTKVNFSISKVKKNQFIVIHYTANNGDTAMNNAKYFYSVHRGASAHYFVDETEVVRVVKDKDVAWHCGTNKDYKHKTCRNSNSIGVEMCSRKDNKGKFYIKQEVIDLTKILVKDLTKKYSVSVENIIMHFDVTGKICPQPMVDNFKLWVDFKEDLKEMIDLSKIYKTLEDVPKWYKPTIKKLVDFGVLRGDEKGNLNLTEEMVRGFVVNDRMGCYENKG